jgi:hypothetical protein
MSGFDPPVITLSANPCLSWRTEDSKGVGASGWNPLKGLVVSVNDESVTNHKVSIIIEPPAPGRGTCCMMFCVPFFPILWPIMCPTLVTRANAHSYSFEQSASGTIDLLHRRKPFFGSEIRNTYNDCTNFRAVVERFQQVPREVHYDSISRSYFILTCKDGEIKLPTGENFWGSSLLKLNEIADVVNNLIASSMERRLDLNRNLRPRTNVKGIPSAVGYYVNVIGPEDVSPATVADLQTTHVEASAVITEEASEASFDRPNSLQ